MAYSIEANDDEEQQSAGQVTVDSRFQVLADKRRQAVLKVFEYRSGPVSLDTLAGAVSEREDGTETADRIAIDLHHRHLPMLDDAGVLEYDPEQKHVTSCRLTFEQLLG